MDLPRGRRTEMQTWDEDDITRFLEVARKTPYFALFHTALFTGMRRSELLALQWCNVDFEYSQIYVTRSLHHLRDGSYVFTQPKSESSRRTVALSPSAVLVLRDHYE
ncbi:site-specific integrase, partial [Dehalococcoidia bacterium]|nr:site-specific integrase [Dehalococcoidia bacterium]